VESECFCSSETPSFRHSINNPLCGSSLRVTMSPAAETAPREWLMRCSASEIPWQGRGVGLRSGSGGLMGRRAISAGTRPYAGRAAQERGVMSSASPTDSVVPRCPSAYSMSSPARGRRESSSLFRCPRDTAVLSPGDCGGNTRIPAAGNLSRAARSGHPGESCSLDRRRLARRTSPRIRGTPETARQGTGPEISPASCDCRSPRGARRPPLQQSTSPGARNMPGTPRKRKAGTVDISEPESACA